ncbi:hypothetical protein ARMGADRAFT_187603 [Armillaria gallica]|uniref:Uncharacterized protein n=1 Tax=Armillaria gallica TaxID=47427 RepID=A0A2H3DLQ4_ARMGA|nr:hypothetical protein ARMGADRAFT_187603 [Armillaria gallica]
MAIIPMLADILQNHSSNKKRSKFIFKTIACTCESQPNSTPTCASLLPLSSPLRARAKAMDRAANPWSSPPPLYSTFPGPDNRARADPSNGQTPLNTRTTKRLREYSYTLKVMIGLLLFVVFTWHLFDDYSNTHRTDVQEKIIRARESAVARREQTIQAKEDAMRQDEEHRKRAGLIWQDLTPEKRCLSYEKRMYQAKLINIPYGEDAQSWCMKTAIDIHGITYDHPDLCTNERQDGAVSIVGHWTVTSNEPTCKTWWGNHKKKGCYGPRKMRVEAHMFNHQEPWDNWAEMCFSTPSEIGWKSFAHPDTCENKGKSGITGTWFIEVDESECP